MKKKLLLLSCAIMALLILVGCKKITPTDVVNSYFDDLKSGTNSSLYRESLRQGLDEYAEQIPDSCFDALVEKVAVIEVTTTSEEINDTKATVFVKVKGINLDKVLDASLSEIPSSATTDAQIMDIFWKSFEKHLKSAELVERDAKINLEKINNTWNVIQDDDDYSIVLWG